MGIKKFIINSGTIACLKERLPITNHFRHVSNLFFFDKSSNSNKITLVEKGSILQKNNDIAENFNDLLTSVVSKLDILRYQDPLIGSDQSDERIRHPILRIIGQYKNYPSIIAINN